jgi:hypothetical protein
LKTRVKADRSHLICWHFCWYLGEQTFAATFAIPNKGIEQMARKNDGACGNPKLIRTDVDCRAARPKFDKDAWSLAKISDVTGGGSGGISAAVGDIKATKEVTFTAQQSADGKISVSVDPFQF